jgi:hypothetical protein
MEGVEGLSLIFYYRTCDRVVVTRFVWLVLCIDLAYPTSGSSYATSSPLSSLPPRTKSTDSLKRYYTYLTGHPTKEEPLARNLQSEGTAQTPIRRMKEKLDRAGLDL